MNKWSDYLQLIKFYNKSLFFYNKMYVYGAKVYSVTVPLLYFILQYQKVQTNDKLSENSWNKHFHSTVMLALTLLAFLSVDLHESGTRNALLGPCINNTEVY
jgi:hypothetical protein